MVTENTEGDSEGQMQLSDDDEEDLCKVWDMAMDKVRSSFSLSTMLHIHRLDMIFFAKGNCIVLQKCIIHETV